MQNEMKRVGRMSQAGFTMVELLLVMMVTAIMMAAVFIGYKSVNSSNTLQNETTALAQLLAGIKSTWQGYGSYAGLTPTAINAANLVSRPLTGATTVITDAYGNSLANIVLNTGNTAFFMEIPATPATCPTIVAALDSQTIAIDVTVATSATYGTTSTATWVKNTATGVIDPAKATTACNLATPFIRAYVQ